jgi:hypothetical protein
MIAVSKSSVAMVRIAPIVGGKTPLAHQSQFNADNLQVNIEAIVVPEPRASERPLNPAAITC